VPTKSSQPITANDTQSSQPIETTETKPQFESVPTDLHSHSNVNASNAQTQPFTFTSHFCPARYRTASTSSTNQISDTLYSELVDCVRNQTNVSYDSSKAAVSVVLSELRDRVPAVKDVMETILNCLHNDKVM
jgi:hypothetical protein